MNNVSFLGPSAQLVSTVRDELRERRRVRAERRTLERELGAYTTQSDAIDLLAALEGHDDAGSEEIRDIVLRNQLRHGLHRAS